MILTALYLVSLVRAPTLFSLCSLRPITSHHTKPSQSYLTLRPYTLQNQIQIVKFSDLPLTLVFKFLHEICKRSPDKCEHYYIVMLLEFKGIYAGSEQDQSSV